MKKDWSKLIKNAEHVVKSGRSLKDYAMYVGCSYTELSRKMAAKRRGEK
jgi:hypothetical protein